MTDDETRRKGSFGGGWWSVRQSGLSIRAWCRKHDVHEHSFYWWRRAGAEGTRPEGAIKQADVCSRACRRRE